VGHEPAVCLCSPARQPDPGLHPKQSGQQLERGDAAAVFCTDEASPGVLHLDMGSSSVQERHGTAGVYPEEGRESDPGDGTPPVQGQDERAGAVQPEEKALVRLESALSVSEEGL